MKIGQLSEEDYRCSFTLLLDSFLLYLWVIILLHKLSLNSYCSSIPGTLHALPPC